jgi:multidrug transporter EmrE-like cation transporter
MLPSPLAAMGASLLAAAGQLLLKMGASGRTGVFEFANLPIAFGLACYAAGVILWIYALSVAPLYVVYPFTMLTFVLVGLASFLLLGEQPSALAMGGWIVILAGIALVGFGSL